MLCLKQKLNHKMNLYCFQWTDYQFISYHKPYVISIQLCMFLVLYTDIFDKSLSLYTDTSFRECERFPYLIRFNYFPPHLIYTECNENTVWLNSTSSCSAIADTGCRMSWSCSTFTNELFSKNNIVVSFRLHTTIDQFYTTEKLWLIK
jgi:hypothetical protein